MKRTSTKLTAALLLVVTPLTAQAQSSSGNNDAPAVQPVQPTQPTPEQLVNYNRARVILALFSQAFVSNKVPRPVKLQLNLCLYNRRMSQISAQTGRVLENNPNLDATNPQHILRAASAVCGVTFTSDKIEEATAPEGNDAGGGDEGGR